MRVIVLLLTLQHVFIALAQSPDSTTHGYRPTEPCSRSRSNIVCMYKLGNDGHQQLIDLWYSVWLVHRAGGQSVDGGCICPGGPHEDRPFVHTDSGIPGAPVQLNHTLFKELCEEDMDRTVAFCEPYENAENNEAEEDKVSRLPPPPPRRGVKRSRASGSSKPRQCRAQLMRT